jgi:hypothetical protein
MKIGEKRRRKTPVLVAVKARSGRFIYIIFQESLEIGSNKHQQTVKIAFLTFVNLQVA